MLKTTVTMLCLAAAVADAQQADAPVQVRLVPDAYTDREATLATRESAASVLKGVGVTALVLGGLAAIGWGALEAAQLRSTFSSLVLSPYGYGRYTMNRADYTPVAGLAIAMASAGLVSLVTGALMQGIASSQRDIIAQERKNLEEQAQAAFWARMDAEAAEIEAVPGKPIPETVVHATPSAPPPPPDVDGAKKPLVPR